MRLTTRDGGVRGCPCWLTFACRAEAMSVDVVEISISRMPDAD
jgi:hypothetical protein